MSSKSLVPSKYPIQPLPLSGGQPVPRPNIRSYDSSDTTGNVPNPLNLYLQALRYFMAMSDLDDLTSYFRIAGIHGAPYVGWDSVDSQGPGPIGNENFCPHNTILFPTWHRVYMMLFEQRIYDIMTNQIIPSKPKADQDAWTQVLDNWRLPAWEWAVPFQASGSTTATYGIPEIFEPQTLGGAVNPLYKFVNSKTDPLTGQPLMMGDSGMGKYAINIPGDQMWNICQATSRYANPDPNNSDILFEQLMAGVNDYTDLNTALNAEGWIGEHNNPNFQKPTGKTLGQVVYILLTTNFTSYFAFASTEYDANVPADQAISIEYIHNNIHDWTGGDYGHMADIAVAAFDPIFWHHHCYIDSLFDMWQRVTSYAHWFDAGDITPVDKLNSSSPLDPFHKDILGNSYTSDDVKTTDTLNYLYPDYPKDPTQLKAWINTTFGTSRKRAQALKGKIEGLGNHYAVNVIYDRSILKTPYSIVLYLSYENPKTHQEEKLWLGEVATLSGANVAQCDNCAKQKKAGRLSRAQVVLTESLLDLAENGNHPLHLGGHIKLGANPGAHADGLGVWALLKNNLKYEVRTKRSAPIAIDDARLEDLKLSVMVANVDHSDDDNVLSSFTDFRTMYTLHRGQHLDAGHELGNPWRTPLAGE